MTKKFTSVLLLLVSCVMSALAQQVESTPTTWSELTTGDYLVLVTGQTHQIELSVNSLSK